VPGDSLHPTPRDRFLPHPGVRPVDSDRDLVVGVVLDQRGVVAGARLHRSAQRPDDGDAELRNQPDPASRLLYQSYRRLDDRLSRLRLLRAARVRVRQRRYAQRRPDPHADRPQRLTATDCRRRPGTPAERKY